MPCTPDLTSVVLELCHAMLAISLLHLLTAQDAQDTKLKQSILTLGAPEKRREGGVECALSWCHLRPGFWKQRHAILYGTDELQNDCFIVIKEAPEPCDQ